MSLASSLALREPTPAGPTRTGRDRAVDAGVCVVAAVLGALFLSPTLGDSGTPMSTQELVVDVCCGGLACLSLWGRREWPLGVAVVCVLLGAFSISATPAALLALFSLAARRPIRSVLLVLVLWIPAALVFAAYSPTTDALSVVLVTTPLALAATAWGMFVRARRQLLLSLQERAVRAEADQLLHEDRARMLERTRIAREMHDVLAHRISLMALHAGGLEMRPDLPPAAVRETAVLLRTTAHQALEELRSVIGVLREGPVMRRPRRHLSRRCRTSRAWSRRRDGPAPRSTSRCRWTRPTSSPAPRPRRLPDSPGSAHEHRQARRRHRCRGTGGRHPAAGLHVVIRNRQPVHSHAGPTLPGAGAGLLGLQERVTLAGGTLVHGPDGSGGFVVDAELPWAG